MAHVNVKINGRSYRMACEDGQEEHLETLAGAFDARIADLRGSFGEIGDMRLTVMAALMAADELGEARETIAALEERVRALGAAEATARRRMEARESALAGRVNDAAERLERASRALGERGRDAGR